MRGKAALREYWCTALKAVPDLHFDIVGVYRGASVLVINYRNQSGTLVNEVLEFDGGLVRRGHGTYLARRLAGRRHPGGDVGVHYLRRRRGRSR